NQETDPAISDSTQTIDGTSDLRFTQKSGDSGAVTSSTSTNGRGSNASEATGAAVAPRVECPGCCEQGVRTLFSGRDRLYRTTDQSFLLVECKSCRLIRLEPRPSLEELARYYPPEYWFAPEADTASKMEESYRCFVLRDHVNFVMRAMENAGGS